MARVKSTETEVKEDIKVEIPVEETVEVKDAEKEEMKLKLELLEKQLEQIRLQSTQVPQVNIIQDRGSSGKKAKCINLMNCELNVSTEPDGGGKVFTFSGYGDSKVLKFDQISDIVNSYPYTMENGLLYIADSDIVDELGLTDDYTKIYTKETLDELIYLRRESDVDLLFGMEENLRNVTLKRIAELFNANEAFDYNTLRKIKNTINVDIEDLAVKLKISDPNISPEDKEALV